MTRNKRFMQLLIIHCIPESDNYEHSKLCLGYTLRSIELCDLFTECGRHEVNKEHSPETEVYNMLLYGAY